MTIRCAPSPTTVWGARGRDIVAHGVAFRDGLKEWRATLEIARQTGSGQDSHLLENGDIGFPTDKGQNGLDAVDQLNTYMQAVGFPAEQLAALDNAG